MTTPITMLAIDLAKGSFQVCAIGQDGAVLYNRMLSRSRLATLLAEQQCCIVAMEACATSHYWGRVAQSHGHEVRLVPAAYVKPFVKRQKNDAADAEAIAEAASRPTMRFVAVKSAETQGRAVAFRTHQCLVRQRTQLINALRGHLAEFGLVAPKGPASLKVLETALADDTSTLPGAVREIGGDLPRSDREAERRDRVVGERTRGCHEDRCSAASTVHHSWDRPGNCWRCCRVRTGSRYF